MTRPADPPTTDAAAGPRAPADARARLPIRDEHVAGWRALPSPEELDREMPVGDEALATIASARRAIRSMLSGADPRLLVIVGPCSVDDASSALEYARRLAELAPEVDDVLYPVMRVYFEKPRTTVGWKGLINDPHLDDSGDVATGIRTARRLLIDIAELGLATATEFLEPVVPQYIAELVAWGAIGARTTESPTHRQMASGLSMPVGFKNGTDGSLEIALNGMIAAGEPHYFLGIEPGGRVAVIETTGNPDRHLILRGGQSGPNFDAAQVRRASERLVERGLSGRVMVDCSHGNSAKDPDRQPAVVDALLRQIEAGPHTLLGWMIESYLLAGRQELPADPAARLRGLSITDACLGWEDTRSLMLRSAETVRAAG